MFIISIGLALLFYTVAGLLMPSWRHMAAFVAVMATVSAAMRYQVAQEMAVRLDIARPTFLFELAVSLVAASIYGIAGWFLAGRFSNR